MFEMKWCAYSSGAELRSHLGREFLRILSSETALIHSTTSPRQTTDSTSMAFVSSIPLITSREATLSRASPRRRTHHPSRRAPRPVPAHRTITTARLGPKRQGNEIRGKVFVVHDNIDTDQIIPAEYLTLVPSDPVEYRKLGSYALIGLPSDRYPTPYIAPGTMDTEFPIVIAGQNFGCGSSREHAPVALGACGACAVVAQSYARIFFRNCSATGELYPWETQQRIVDEFETGDVGVIDFERCVIKNERTAREYPLNALGDVQPVIDAGGIFEYARQSGMISSKE